jgi:hypothetical protein
MLKGCQQSNGSVLAKPHCETVSYRIQTISAETVWP